MSCFSLSVAQVYRDTPRNFGRGVTCYVDPPPCWDKFGRFGLGPEARVSGFRPHRFSISMRVQKRANEQGDRGEHPACVGYVVLSDGRPGARTSQGRFGTEAVFLMIDCSDRDNMWLRVVGGPQGSMCLCDISRFGSHDEDPGGYYSNPRPKDNGGRKEGWDSGWFEIQIRLDWASSCSST